MFPLPRINSVLRDFQHGFFSDLLKSGGGAVEKQHEEEQVSCKLYYLEFSFCRGCRSLVNRPFATNDSHGTKSAMLEDKLIIIPALGHQNKDKSSFTGSGYFVSMSQCGNNHDLPSSIADFCILYHVIACCKRPIKRNQKSQFMICNGIRPIRLR